MGQHDTRGRGRVYGKNLKKTRSIRKHKKNTTRHRQTVKQCGGADKTVRILIHKPQIIGDIMSMVKVYDGNAPIDGLHDLVGIMNLFRSTSAKIDDELNVVMNGINPPYKEYVLTLNTSKQNGKQSVKTVRIFLRKDTLSDNMFSEIRLHLDNDQLDGYDDLAGIINLLQIITNHTEEELYEIMRGLAGPPYKEFSFRINSRNELEPVEIKPRAQGSEPIQSPNVTVAKRNKPSAKPNGKGASVGGIDIGKVELNRSRYGRQYKQVDRFQ